MKYRFTGNIGLKASLNIYGIDQLNDFMRKNKGNTFVCEMVTEEKSSSKALQSYYRQKVVPDFKDAYKLQGEYLTLNMVEARLDQMSPFVEDGHTAYGLPQSDMILHIDFIKQIAAKEFSFFIDDPRTL